LHDIVLYTNDKNTVFLMLIFFAVDGAALASTFFMLIQFSHIQSCDPA